MPDAFSTNASLEGSRASSVPAAISAACSPFQRSTAARCDATSSSFETEYAGTHRPVPVIALRSTARPPASAHPPRAVAPVRLAQHELLQLSGRGARQRRHELDRARALEVREVLPAEREQLGLARARARAQHDESLGRLAPLLVGHADHRALEHRLVAVERVLDLGGADVLAARDDDVLLAVDDVEAAGRVPHAEVARVEPAALDRARGLVGLLVVAAEDDVRARADLADAAPVARDLAALVVEQPER